MKDFVVNIQEKEKHDIKGSRANLLIKIKKEDKKEKEK